MRFLHTADWHLGRPFHGASLLDAQAAMVEHLVALARDSRVDGILVAGDVYDRALPPVDAVRLADEALSRLSEVAPVVVISGNHDSAARLGFGSSLLDRAGVHVRTSPATVARPVLLGTTAIYAVPYLEPDLTRAALDCEGRSHVAVLGAAMARIRTDLGRRPDGTRCIVMAHAFVAGAEPSASERDLSVGGAPSVPASTFADADYVALGHIHQPQRVGRNGRYAGAPVALSFSEAGQRKTTTIVELPDPQAQLELLDGAPRTELVDVPVLRPLADLRGELDAVLADPRHDRHEGSWVQVTLTDPVRPSDAMERLRARFPHTVALVFDPQGADAVATGRYTERLRGLDDAELLARFVEDVRGREADDDESTLLRDALTAGRVAAVSA